MPAAAKPLPIFSSSTIVLVGRRSAQSDDAFL